MDSTKGDSSPAQETPLLDYLRPGLSYRTRNAVLRMQAFPPPGNEIAQDLLVKPRRLSAGANPSSFSGRGEVDYADERGRKGSEPPRDLAWMTGS